jgi:hypothetical protein
MSAPDIEDAQKKCLLDAVKGVITAGVALDPGSAGVRIRAPMATSETEADVGSLTGEILVRRQHVEPLHDILREFAVCPFLPAQWRRSRKRKQSDPRLNHRIQVC